VTAIITRKRSSTADELQDIIANAKAYKLTAGEREQLCLDLSIQVAQRARQVNGKREDASARFISDLGYAQTPFGLLAERAWFQNELQTGTKAIAACRRHVTPDCSCWREARENLYSIRESFEARSPESWAALRVWEALEEIELSSRPERESGTVRLKRKADRWGPELHDHGVLRRESLERQLSTSAPGDLREFSV
jgi:hypothetical protein